MRVTKGGLLFALSCALLGCEAAPVPGAGCVRTSECPAPLVCNQGRCREECTDHRDCPLMARCIAGNDGLGVCTLPDDVCDADRPCGEGLICARGECFDACAGAACPAGGVCAAGLCVAPPPSGDAGVSPLPPHRSCTASTDCGAGEHCTRIGTGRFACRRECASVAACEGALATSTCVLAEVAEGSNRAVCSVPCDLFGGGGCAGDETCDVVPAWGVSTARTIAIECRAVDPARRGQGEDCTTGVYWDESLCAPGLACDGGLDGPFTCRQLCTTGGTLGPACPAGTSCVASPTFPSPRLFGATIGTCVSP